MDTGIIKVIQHHCDGSRSMMLEALPALIPKPGQYLLASPAGQPDSVLGWPLFPMGLTSSLGDAATYLGPIPETWRLNTRLKLRGPLGHGFMLPANTRKLVLASWHRGLERLYPLAPPALASGADVVVCATESLDHLPPAVEIQHPDNLPDLLTWADFLACEIPLEHLNRLRTDLQLDPGRQVPCLAQVLIWTPMPCAGIGACGACAVPAGKRGYQLACKDGPVFDLSEIRW